VNPMRLIVPLLAVAAGLWGGYALMHAVAPKSDKASAGSPGSSGSSGEAPSGPPPELNGGDAKSMLRPEQLRKALAIMRREGGGVGARLSYIRLAPGRINTAIDGDGKDITLYLAPDGRLYDRSESSSGPGSPADDIRVGRIPAGAPWKIVRTLGEKADIEPDDVDYMLIQVDSISGKAEWLVYLKGVNRSYYRAALNGAHPKRCC
jgi:hypothetical protein